MSRIFVTGDCHCEYRKLNFHNFPESRALTKDDYVIVCGDFGYWDRSKEQAYWLDWLEDRQFTTLWVDGNHENYDLLKELPAQEWKGGKVQFCRPSVIHLMRGQIFEIAGKKFFAFGGARSHDISGGILEMDDPQYKEKMHSLQRQGALFRVNHFTWWQEEMPSKAEMDEGLKNLERAGWKADYIITHCCASSLVRANHYIDNDTNELTEFFEDVRGRCDYGHWLFGHYHVNGDWGEKDTCLYARIVELEEGGYKRCGAVARFKHHEIVRFLARGKNGPEEYVGKIVHIEPLGGGLYEGVQPTANIHTEDGRFHKYIPYQDIRKIIPEKSQDENRKENE